MWLTLVKALNVRLARLRKAVNGLALKRNVNPPVVNLAYCT